MTELPHSWSQKIALQPLRCKYCNSGGHSDSTTATDINDHTQIVVDVEGFGEVSSGREVRLIAVATSISATLLYRNGSSLADR
jgi:hypothetical protein